MPPRRAIAALALVAALAVALRFAGAATVYGGGAPRLVGDTDPHYHVLQSERILRRAPGSPWRDPGLDWPNGAEVPWPPLLDALVAGAAAAVHGAGATRDQIAAVAAAVPPLLGAVSALLVAALSAALLGRAGFVLAGLLVALLPAHAKMTVVGRADQHALELVLAPALWLASVVAWRDPDPARRRRATAAIAVLVAVAFWSWMGSAFLLAFPAIAAAALHVGGAPEAPRAARSLALGAAGGAVLLAASIGLLGPPGALLRAGALGVTGLHAAIAAGVSAFAALLAAAPRLRRAPPALPRRIAEAALAAAVALGAALGLSPSLRDGTLRGLVALRAAGPWYSGIGEFLPILGSGYRPLAQDALKALGLFGLAAPAAVAGAVIVLRRRGEGDRSGALVAVAWGAALAAAACARIRFTPYAALLVAPLAAVALSEGAAAVAARLGRPSATAAALAALVLAAVLPTAGQWTQPPPTEDPAVVEALEWLGRRPARPDGRDGVAAAWDHGHSIQYHARRPVLASPFGTEAGAGCLADLAAFVHATDEATALDVLRRRRIGHVLSGDPVALAIDVRGFEPPGAPEVVGVTLDRVAGPRIEPLPAVERLVVSRLDLLDGTAAPSGAPPLSGFRLVYETGAGGRPTKLWEVVEGARLAVDGAMPDAEVLARVNVTTNRGRRFKLVLSSRADASGRAAFRVPYATGPNGASTSSDVMVTDRARVARVSLAEETVLLGGEVHAGLAERR